MRGRVGRPWPTQHPRYLPFSAHIDTQQRERGWSRAVQTAEEAAATAALGAEGTRRTEESSRQSATVVVSGEGKDHASVETDQHTLKVARTRRGRASCNRSVVVVVESISLVLLLRAHATLSCLFYQPTRRPPNQKERERERKSDH